MQIWPVFPFGLVGLICGAGLWQFFRKMPGKWLLDYDETELTPELLQKQRLPVLPDLLVLMLADLAVFVMGWLFLGLSLQLFVVLSAAQPLLLIMVSDAKTRIIPDQFTLVLIPCAVLLWLAEGMSGEVGWLPGLLYRILGGIAGGLLLFFCGWLAEKLLHKEAMGMGDIKLLAACGLLVSLANMPMLLILAFLSAAFLAVPLLIRRMRDPERSSDMPFGPFIALATLLVLLLTGPINRLWDLYVNLLI
jgi:prepilin signal peptidase PulO-like enzyme (type II secretory pathway)